MEPPIQRHHPWTHRSRPTRQNPVRNLEKCQYRDQHHPRQLPRTEERTMTNGPPSARKWKQLWKPHRFRKVEVVVSIYPAASQGMQLKITKSLFRLHKGHPKLSTAVQTRNRNNLRRKRFLHLRRSLAQSEQTNGPRLGNRWKRHRWQDLIPPKLPGRLVLMLVKMEWLTAASHLESARGQKTTFH